MSTEIIVTILMTAIAIIAGFWYTTLQVRANFTQDPSEYDPVKKAMRASRILKIFLRRFAVPIIIFASSLHFVLKESFFILSSIFLSLSVTYLYITTSRDRILRMIIDLKEESSSLKEEITKLKATTEKQKPLKEDLLKNITSG